MMKLVFIPLLFISQFLFSQQTFVKRINRSILQGDPGSGVSHVADIFVAGNCIYFGGHKNYYSNSGTGFLEIYKMNKNGNLLWIKNYAMDDVAGNYASPKIVFLKDGIYVSSVSGYSSSYGLNLTKIDTANGNVIYSKKIELYSNQPPMINLWELQIVELDTTHVLLNCGYAILKYNVITETVDAASLFDVYPYTPLFSSIVVNSKYSSIISGSLNNGVRFTMKIKNDNLMTIINGTDFGNYGHLFRKNNKIILGIQEAFFPPYTNWFCEFDTALNLTKCMMPNGQINTITGGYFKRFDRLFIQSKGLNFIIDSSYNCLQSRNEYLPQELTGTLWWNGFTGPITLFENGIYSVKTNSTGIGWDKSVIVRSDTNFIDPCNSAIAPILFTPTTVPTANIFTCNITSITPTVTSVNYTVTSLSIGDTTYCTTTTGLVKINLNQYKLSYTDRSVKINAEKRIKEAILLDIYGRKIRKLEGLSEFEIAFGFEVIGIYFVEIYYLDNTVTRIKVLLQ